MQVVLHLPTPSTAAGLLQSSNRAFDRLATLLANLALRIHLASRAVRNLLVRVSRGVQALSFPTGRYDLQIGCEGWQSLQCQGWQFLQLQRGSISAIDARVPQSCTRRMLTTQLAPRIRSG